jgi:hypothetical protein
MARRLTNEDLVKNLMNFSPYGVLGQMFIMNAIREYAREVIDNGDELINNEEKMMAEGKIPVMSHKAWVGVANDIAERMDYFFDPKNNNKLKY